MQFRELRWRLLVKHGGIMLALAFVAGAIFIWSGFFNVAASSRHWVVTTWILEIIRRQSVETYSYFVPEPPPLDDEGMIRLGAAHYEGGCAPCHSRPGEPINAIVQAMLPHPPLLARVVADEDTKALFWTIKHGLKFTAMPAWPAQDRGDEVWALTAFVRRLPEISPEEYRDLAGLDRQPGEPQSDQELAQSSESVALTQCVRCHGDETSPPLSDLIPVLHGQSEAYLGRALREYTAGLRPSGAMQPVAGLLDQGEIQALAAHYAGLEAAPAAPQEEPERVERGRMLAVRGDIERDVPPCLDCHSDVRPAAFPALAGQHARYLANQLEVWRSGGRDRTAYGRIMAVVAQRLTAEQVRDVAAYFSSLEPGEAPETFGLDAAAAK